MVRGQNKNLEQELKQTREFFVDKFKENEEQKKIINDFRNQNFELREDLGTYKNQYNKLFDENKQLKSTQQELINDVRKYSCKYLDLENENKELKKEIVHLKECNLRYRNHNELLESIIGI
ncbi:MAG: hypothetical protein ACTJH3_11455 [Staphylococcus equorum]